VRDDRDGSLPALRVDLIEGAELARVRPPGELYTPLSSIGWDAAAPAPAAPPPAQPRKAAVKRTLAAATPESKRAANFTNWELATGDRGRDALRVEEGILAQDADAEGDIPWRAYLELIVGRSTARSRQEWYATTIAERRWQWALGGRNLRRDEVAHGGSKVWFVRQDALLREVRWDLRNLLPPGGDRPDPPIRPARANRQPYDTCRSYRTLSQVFS
jgi:hypothetical protein